VHAYVDEPDGRRTLGEARSLGVTPLAPQELPPGSYLLTFAAEGAAEIRLPLLLRRAEAVAVAPSLPAADRVPDGFVAIPAGRFLFGTAVDEDLRKGFLAAVPLHEVAVESFLIARDETTYAAWIAFLEALPPAERAMRTPGGGPGGFHQVAALATLAPGVWQLRMSKGEQVFTARSGSPLRYPTRKQRNAQDWLRLPVSGIDWADAAAYLAWLDRTGRVPGARFCSELEWEYAARGADGRPFPTGARIGPDEANFDETYDRDFAAMGPDEVGSYPASHSPFGVHDTMGNVFEWTTSALAVDEKVARGGGFFFGALTGSAMNRAIFSADFRDGSLGLRVCAPAVSSPSPR
jgi:formylglycine-generating enzyme required for sulfatase activity